MSQAKRGPSSAGRAALQPALLVSLKILNSIHVTGGAAKSIHPTPRKKKYIVEKTAGFLIILHKTIVW